MHFTQYASLVHYRLNIFYFPKCNNLPHKTDQCERGFIVSKIWNSDKAIRRVFPPITPSLSPSPSSSSSLPSSSLDRRLQGHVMTIHFLASAIRFAFFFTLLGFFCLSFGFYILICATFAWLLDILSLFVLLLDDYCYFWLHFSHFYLCFGYFWLSHYCFIFGSLCLYFSHFCLFWLLDPDLCYFCLILATLAWILATCACFLATLSRFVLFLLEIDYSKIVWNGSCLMSKVMELFTWINCHTNLDIVLHEL